MQAYTNNFLVLAESLSRPTARRRDEPGLFAKLQLLHIYELLPSLGIKSIPYDDAVNSDTKQEGLNKNICSLICSVNHVLLSVAR